MSTTKEEAISRLQTEQIDLNDKGQMLEVISFKGISIDFWPSTGTFITRPDNENKSKGLNNLIRYVKNN